VRIAGFEYRPVQLIVRRGTRVTWVNADTTDHTVTFTKSPRDLGNVDPGKRLSARFRTPGRYAYVCQYHPSMHGAVVVW
jgi:plastocyanin